MFQIFILFTSLWGVKYTTKPMYIIYGQFHISLESSKMILWYSINKMLWIYLWNFNDGDDVLRQKLFESISVDNVLKVFNEQLYARYTRKIPPALGWGHVLLWAVSWGDLSYLMCSQRRLRSACTSSAIHCLHKDFINPVLIREEVLLAPTILNRHSFIWRINNLFIGLIWKSYSCKSPCIYFLSIYIGSSVKSEDNWWNLTAAFTEGNGRYFVVSAETETTKDTSKLASYLIKMIADTIIWIRIIWLLLQPSEGAIMTFGVHIEWPS